MQLKWFRFRFSSSKFPFKIIGNFPEKYIRADNLSCITKTAWVIQIANPILF